MTTDHWLAPLASAAIRLVEFIVAFVLAMVSCLILSILLLPAAQAWG